MRHHSEMGMGAVVPRHLHHNQLEQSQMSSHRHPEPKFTPLAYDYHHGHGLPLFDKKLTASKHQNWIEPAHAKHINDKQLHSKMHEKHAWPTESEHFKNSGQKHQMKRSTIKEMNSLDQVQLLLS